MFHVDLVESFHVVVEGVSVVRACLIFSAKGGGVGEHLVLILVHVMESRCYVPVVDVTRSLGAEECMLGELVA